MDKSEMIARVNKTLSEEFEIEDRKLVPEAKFKEDLEFDSLDAVDLVIVLEEEFKIKIGKDPAIMQITTLADLYKFIEGKASQYNL